MRLELFFKTAGELQALIALVRQNGIGAVNLVNKAKADPLLQQIRTIKVCLSSLYVCVGGRLGSDVPVTTTAHHTGWNGPTR